MINNKNSEFDINDFFSKSKIEKKKYIFKEAKKIATPNSLHHKWVLEIIKKNKNILVEKPATVSFSEADSIKNKLIGKDLFFAEAFMYRYLPQTKSLVDILEHQEIGDLFSMNSCFGINLLTKKKFLFFNKKKKINPKDIKF